jgi:hypothetical protein
LEKCKDDLSERSAATPGHLNAAAAREYRDHISLARPLQFAHPLYMASAWRCARTNPWARTRARVAQVDRGSCALIFSDQWTEKVGKGLMFISLNVEPETHEAAVAALDALRAEFEARGVPVKDGHWGYRLLVVEDLDGNQLFFNYPNEP